MGNANVRRVMPVPSALVCVRCSVRYPVDRYAQDCPACRAKGAPANLTVAYDAVPGIGTDRESIRRDRGSMWRWEGFLHAPAAEAVSLGEGNTPLLPAPSLGLGDVWIKDESRNPTWSFKDRLGSGALTMARRFGAKGDRLEFVRQRRRVGGGLCRQGRHSRAWSSPSSARPAR
jgi:threonine synthase